LVEIWLPYGKTEVSVRVPEESLVQIVEPKMKNGVPDGSAEITGAVQNPIGTGRLKEMAQSNSKVAIVVDDVTRPAPTRLMIPPILQELHEAGVSDENVTVIFATGIHRDVRPDEMAGLIGEDIYGRVKAVSHNSVEENCVHLGNTSFGTKVYINRIFAEADVKILTGDVELHWFAGYGGGRKSVHPGITSAEAVQQNHSLLFHPNAKAGVLEGNPVHMDMDEAAQLAKVDFTLNVVLNSKNEIVRAIAGDCRKVLSEGVKTVDEMYKVPVSRKADIVVASAGGSPHDINFHQSHKGIESVLNIVKEGGAIILVAECPEGHGNEVFYEWMMNFKTSKEMEAKIKKKFITGGHKAYYLTRALEKFRIYLVSVMPDSSAADVFRLRTAKTVSAALQMALRALGKDSKIAVVPQAAGTLPILQQQS